ncbi:hypothetical protein C9374_012862 [Naegleria lovaniensis]|uniref:Protein kinase domain-containing protein n=1 Tax=Naegleria lovaniensis TaxID=51637 RepID=A0AA88KBK1_NAELO|nr:uncharacterized protein C9374_012862 [Naegleria lovaniensis]KAG2373130.1 hypothetical protein C9374_012862 [Naegleria lovaniensis]
MLQNTNSYAQQEEVSLEEEFLSASFKVIVRLEFSSSLPSEKVILKLKPNTSYQTLVQELFNVFHQIPSSSYFQIKYFDEDAESEVCIRNDEQVSCFLEQYKDPNVLKEHKQLVFCIFDSSTTNFPLPINDLPVTRQNSLHPLHGIPSQNSISEFPNSNPHSSSNVITSQDLELVKKKFIQRGCVSHKIITQESSVDGPSFVEFLCIHSQGASPNWPNERLVKVLKLENVDKSNQIMKELKNLKSQLYQQQPLNRSIVSIMDVFRVGNEDSRLVAIEMEYLKHNLWSKVIQKRMLLTEKMLFDIVKQTCQALEFLDQQCIQREINPHNMYLRSLDFSDETLNIAIVPKGNLSENCLVANISREKQYYQAPENLTTNKHHNSLASDIFSLGAVLYQLITLDMETLLPPAVNSLSSTHNIQEIIKIQSKIPYSNSLYSLISHMLTESPQERISMTQLVSDFPNTPNADMYYTIGCHFFSLKHYTHAKTCFVKAANHGHVLALNRLGVLYCEGLGVAQQFRTALLYFQKAASKGNAKAQFNVGLCYETGRGVLGRECDYQNAEKYYLAAAQQNHVQAQVNLGLLYLENKLSCNNSKFNAHYWLKKAATQHQNLIAQHEIGFMYFKDHYYSKALKWLTRSALQGYAKAQNDLGLMYALGKGVDKDFTQAFEWFEKAANQNFAVAQYNLGVMYEKGDGVQQDETQARKWYRKAAQQDHKGAFRKLGGLDINIWTDGVKKALLHGQLLSIFICTPIFNESSYQACRD